jgi:hypothetical protein
MMCVHSVSFTGFTVHHSSGVTFFSRGSRLFLFASNKIIVGVILNKQKSYFQGVLEICPNPSSSVFEFCGENHANFFQCFCGPHDCEYSKRPCVCTDACTSVFKEGFFFHVRTSFSIMINTKRIEKLKLDKEYMSWQDRQAAKSKKKVRM